MINLISVQFVSGLFILPPFKKLSGEIRNLVHFELLLARLD